MKKVIAIILTIVGIVSAMAGNASVDTVSHAKSAREAAIEAATR